MRRRGIEMLAGLLTAMFLASCLLFALATRG